MKDKILEHWNSQAEKFGTDHQASWGDNFAIDLEIENISKFIPENGKILDAGCANGWSALHHLDKKPKSITGVDFSPEMIKNANKNKVKYNSHIKIEFLVSDIRELSLQDNFFDFVYTTRTIINLNSWDEQKQAINECLRVVKPHGKVLISEAFIEPMNLLNSLRSLKNLPPLKEPFFNNYIKEENLKKYLKENHLKYTEIDFSSIYYLGSRFLRELVTDSSEYSGYSNPINQIFYGIEKEFSGGGFGIQKAYLIEKNN